MRHRAWLLVLGLVLCVAAPKSAVAQTPPDEIQMTVTWNGEQTLLVLRRHSLRAATFRVLTDDGSGVLVEQPAAPFATYRGTLQNDLNSLVTGVVDEAGGVTAQVLAPNAHHIRLTAPPPTITADGVAVTRATAVQEVEPPPFVCGVKHAGSCNSSPHPQLELPNASRAPSPQETPGRGALGPESSSDTMHLAQIAFDVDLQYFQRFGQNVERTVRRIEEQINDVDFFYARDLLLTYELTAVVIRTAQAPYDLTGVPSNERGGALLTKFREEWNTNRQDIVRDLTHLMTAQPDLSGAAGLAFVGVVCTESAYGWSYDGSNIVGHETGHNWGAGHCHDVAPCNTMCGSCYSVGPNTKAIMEAHRDSRTCVDPDAPYATAVRPYATPEAAVLSFEDLVAGQSATFTVLDNDHDANFDGLSIASFSETSARGGTLSQLGAQLTYTPPAEPFLGDDRFEYTVADGTGRTAGATVPIAVRYPAYHWTLDESAGTEVFDSGPGAKHGGASGGASWTTGRYGSALAFDGTNDAVTLAPLNLFSNTVTITGWVRRSGGQNPFSGLFFSRAGRSVAGLHMGEANELRYSWNDAEDTWGWRSGLVLPNKQWAFVALVVTPGQATIYLDSGGGLRSAVNAIPHDIEEFDGAFSFGSDPDFTDRFFKGTLDDVQVFPRALDPEELAELRDGRRGATNPTPAHGTDIFGRGALTLAWTAAPGAKAHHVYFGTSFRAVYEADPGSPEFKGSQVGTSFAAGDPADGRYFWRIDEVLANKRVRPGVVWEFTRKPDQPDNHWTLDEVSGTTATDIVGGKHGTYVNNPTLGVPGAAPGTATAVGFDGVDDLVRVPALNYATNKLTITAWVRRSGAQKAFSGLVFSRAGGTVAGVHFGTASELRYSWNDASNTWGWNSGLVPPDGQWVFVALVVEPGQGTIYLHDGTAWRSAVNPVGHGIEEFDGNLFMGRDRDASATTSRWFKGEMDDVRIFKRALTTTQVQRIRDDAF